MIGGRHERRTKAARAKTPTPTGRSSASVIVWLLQARRHPSHTARRMAAGGAGVSAVYPIYSAQTIIRIYIYIYIYTYIYAVYRLG